GWHKLCCSQDLGGLGFREFESFNQALQAKKGWRMIHNPYLLLSLQLKDK
ncbi:hypothetical protein LINPERPRIM_LOCUS21802, partial [Linum perenne]